ncbi:MAG: MFS transporter [Burkholderiales bacterium]|nr:MFS transporter [Burkholderiales bacterium]
MLSHVLRHLTGLSRARRATRLQFLLLGVVVGTWGTHIPSVSARYALTEATLAVVLLGVAGGTVLSLLIAGRIVGKLGARKTVALSGLAMGAALGSVLEYPDFAALLAGMLVFGAAMSLFDVAINTEGSELESLGSRPIMSNLHGMFSVGGMAGAAMTFALLDLGVAPRAQLLVLGAGVALTAYAGSRFMLETHASHDESIVHFAWPKGTLLLIGALVFAGMTAEGILYDWSVLYLKQDVGMAQAYAALGYGTFCAAMALARFGGDALRARFSERAVLGIGAIVAAVAMAVVLLAAIPWLSFVGLALTGAGLAPIAPILFNAATRVPGVSRAAAIASVTTIGYSGFIVGPPLIGSIATATSLTTALYCVVLAAGLVAWGARLVPDKAGSPR